MFEGRKHLTKFQNTWLGSPTDDFGDCSGVGGFGDPMVYKQSRSGIELIIYLNCQVMFGIEGVEIYFPKTYVDQAEYEKYQGASTGKYTNGLGQLQLSFANQWEDVNSLSLTVVNNLMRNYGIGPEQVGRLEIGTQTLFDKSKSTKTVLMTLFKDNHDIQGVTSINACYGATNALINTLNWISSPFWDGRYGIVVATDIAVYEDGPARCTGGAGAVALLIGPNPKILFQRERATFMDNVYDFYKPNPSSEYPTVDGKLSIECYLRAIEECYRKLKEKCGNKNLLNMDYFCFHSPFYKMVQKAFFKLMKIEHPSISDKECLTRFMEKVHPTLHISQRIGNIYTGSLFSCLISLLLKGEKVQNTNVMLFSYGSGLCSTMLLASIRKNPLSSARISQIEEKLQNRIKVSPQQYTKIMLEKEQNYGKYVGKIPMNQDWLEDNVFYLQGIDEKFRRKYEIRNPIQISLKKDTVFSISRLQHLNKHLPNTRSTSKFYQLGVEERIGHVNSELEKCLDKEVLKTGGLNMEEADAMIENVIGMLSLPLAVVPCFVINNKKHIVPMCIEEPSVVAACSSIGKLLSPYSFYASSTPNIMVGQVHLPHCQLRETHRILEQKTKIMEDLNRQCESMVKRGGGIVDLKIRQLKGPYSKQFSVDVFIDVRDAMGANITNTICQKTKWYISNMGIKTGIAILTNYCLERRALGWFQIPVKELGWKGVSGDEVTKKILEAYQFAKSDEFRAVTHNKGIMNGIDSVCVATGQDWRAVESSAHSFASRSSSYQPLTHYETLQKDGTLYLKGSLELPIAVGCVGGVLHKNPIYKSTMEILKNPSAQQLAEILVCVGLAQNLGALRALAIEGIQKGHMALHGRHKSMMRELEVIKKSKL